MHLPLYPLFPSPRRSAKNCEHTFHMHSWLSLRNMEQLQQLFCLTGPGHWWDGWLPLSRHHQRLFQRLSGDFLFIYGTLLSFLYVCVCVYVGYVSRWTKISPIGVKSGDIAFESRHIHAHLSFQWPYGWGYCHPRGDRFLQVVLLICHLPLSVSAEPEGRWES